MVNYLTVYDEDKQNLFIREDYIAIFVRLAGFYEQHGTPDFHRFAESLEDRELRKIVLESAMVERDPEHAEEEIADCISHLEKYRSQFDNPCKDARIKRSRKNK